MNMQVQLPPMTFWQVILIHVLPELIAAVGVIGAAVFTARYHARKQDKSNKDQRNQIQEIHLSINSRVDDLVKIAKEAAFLAGRKAERDERDKVSG